MSQELVCRIVLEKKSCFIHFLRSCITIFDGTISSGFLQIYPSVSDISFLTFKKLCRENLIQLLDVEIFSVMQFQFKSSHN